MIKDIKGFEGFYQIDDKGNVYSLHNDIVLENTINRDGYCVVTLHKNGRRCQKKVHQLVADTFIPNEENKTDVHHLNRDKKDNRVENLVWLSKEEHSKIHGDKKDRTYIFTEETRLKMSIAKKGRKPSELCRLKSIEAKKGKKQSEETKRKRAESRKKPILQYTKDGKFIREWKSAQDAENELGILDSHICMVLKCKRKSAGGFVWKYK